jgi:glycosyltransferase involved in cell wall biosynthesis
MNNKTIFFCGAMLNHDGLVRYKGETPAASIWIKGFCTGLQNNGISVKCFSPIRDSLFPKGRLFPGQIKYLDNLVSHVLVRYINFPLLRTFSVAYSLEKAIVKEIKAGAEPIAILNYNTYPYYIKALKKVSRRFPKIPWVNVVLDLDDPTKDNWDSFLEDTNGSKGSVFLSWWGYKNAPIKNKHHMDAGWLGTLLDLTKSDKKIFLYAGKYAKFGGIDDIINAIKVLRENDIIFEFYGKDEYQLLSELAKIDKRVHIKGFVTDAVLDAACKKATAFLSPREYDFQGTRMIFPSKIIFYLKYQKPIISAMLPGLSPEYENLLIVPVGNLPSDWAKTMTAVLSYSELELVLLANKCRLLLKKKTWENQAKSLIGFLENINA